MCDMKLILQLELFTLNDLTLKMSQNLYTKQIKDIQWIKLKIPAKQQSYLS